MSTPQKFGILRGDDVVQMLVSIWLDGFLSGGATSLEAVGASEQEAGRLARQVSSRLQSDPLAMLTIEAEVKERLTGADSGDKSITVRGDAS